jgi:hypothetical protein
MTEEMPDLAYYYPAPYWRTDEVDVLKSLLLFFDGIAILLPRYMAGRESGADPILAGPLREKGLLRVLEPETFVDQEVAEALITAVTELVTEGAFDDLERPEYGYQELSRSRMGWDADVELSQMIIEELIARDLARPSEDGVSVPLHPAVRTTFLVLLSQLARGAGRRRGLNLHPATTNLRAVNGLMSVMSLEAGRSARSRKQVASMQQKDLLRTQRPGVLVEEAGVDSGVFLLRLVVELGRLPPGTRAVGGVGGRGVHGNRERGEAVVSRAASGQPSSTCATCPGKTIARHVRPAPHLHLLPAAETVASNPTAAGPCRGGDKIAQIEEPIRHRPESGGPR